MRWLLLISSAASLVASCNPARAPNPANPDDFRLRVRLEATTGTVQRVDLPAAALVAFRRPDRGDVRVFDASNRPLSLALIDDRATGVTTTSLTPIPFESQQQPQMAAPVAVRIESGKEWVAVETRDTAKEPIENRVLLDARRLSGTALALRIEADMPSGRPVQVTIAASSDLKNWMPIAEPILFRANAAGPIVGADRIDFGGFPIAKQYLRLSWSRATKLRINSARLYTSGRPTLSRVRVNAKLPTSTDPHHIEFAITDRNIPAAINLKMTGSDGVLPLRLLGRNSVDEPWTLLALASLRQGAGEAKLEIGSQRPVLYRIEADARSAGFSTTPDIVLEYEPVALVAAFNGNAPYQLAVGNSVAQPAFFQVADLTDRLGPFPLATLDESRATPLTITLAAPNSGPTQRSFWLWLTLIAGVAVLAFVAYRLMKTNSIVE